MFIYIIIKKINTGGAHIYIEANFRHKLKIKMKLHIFSSQFPTQNCRIPLFRFIGLSKWTYLANPIPAKYTYIYLNLI